MKLENIKQYKLKTVSAPLQDFCYLSSEHDLIEVTEWNNAEGFDVKISRKNENQYFSLTHGEIEAITILSKML